jgi:hypothetical protein
MNSSVKIGVYQILVLLAGQVNWREAVPLPVLTVKGAGSGFADWPRTIRHQRVFWARMLLASVNRTGRIFVCSRPEFTIVTMEYMSVIGARTEGILPVTRTGLSVPSKL